MRRVFLSFLGVGAKKEGADEFDYDPARYCFPERPLPHGKEPPLTKFVQAAEIELLGPEVFDEIILVVTAKSRGLHFEKLKAELKDLGAPEPRYIEIEEDMSAAGQWRWFEEILGQIQSGDRLTVDLTHGYRAVPIVFSTAISFLQRARKVVVEGVYYGAYEKNRDLSPIIDMKDFYIINEWAEGVSRLVEDADARKLAELTQEAPDFQVASLNDVELLDKLNDLTNRIRDVDMHKVGEVARITLDRIASSRAGGNAVGDLLLGLIREKYSGIAGSTPPSGKYDLAYFQGQLAYIDLLLEHKLYMQAFTVMRELVGSIGLIENKKAKTNTGKGRDQRKKAEVFISMLQYDEAKWRFDGDRLAMKEGLVAFYGKLKEAGIEGGLRSFLDELLRYRNGFDHGWTSFQESYGDIAEKGAGFSLQLKRTVSGLEAGGILGDSASSR
jgi:hypothetical protein